MLRHFIIKLSSARFFCCTVYKVILKFVVHGNKIIVAVETERITLYTIDSTQASRKLSGSCVHEYMSMIRFYL